MGKETVKPLSAVDWVVFIYKQETYKCNIGIGLSHLGSFCTIHGSMSDLHQYSKAYFKIQNNNNNKKPKHMVSVLKVMSSASFALSWRLAVQHVHTLHTFGPFCKQCIPLAEHY